jgi:endonuclease/exonuclease/phosphatase family metal-dependent hydrolase
MITPRARASPRVRSVSVVVLAATLALSIGATGSALAGPRVSALAPRDFRAMTQNLYLGTNLQPLFGLSGGDLILAAADAYADMVQNDFPARAGAIAREIVADSPDLVSLQEVALWQTGPDPSHLQTSYDYLELLLQALADQGASYKAVAVNVNVSAALPITLDLSTWASFTDRDAIIAKADVPVWQMKLSNPTSQNFDAALYAPIGDTLLRIPRGWSSIDVKFRGKQYRFVDTHLEAYDVDIRIDQAQELDAALAASPIPVVLAGDINSLPDDEAGPYGILTADGFIDSWPQAMGDDPGNTAGQDLDCTIPSAIDHRVDYVMHNDDPYVDAVVGSGDIVGEEDADCTDTDPSLRPSDHAGVVIGLHTASP